MALPKLIFMQYLNPEILSLYQGSTIKNSRVLISIWQKLSKYAVLSSQEGLIIPASYLFEVDEVDQFLIKINTLIKAGLLKYASETAELEKYKMQKMNEYRDELPLFSRYSTNSIESQKIPEGLIWCPRTESSSGTIAEEWREEFLREGGIWSKIITPGNLLGNFKIEQIENKIYEIPELLEGRAFIYRFTKPLIPLNISLTAETRLKMLISRAYLESYLHEFQAAILNDTPLGQLDCQLPQFDKSGRVQTASFRLLRNTFEIIGISLLIENLGWKQILQLRMHPVMQWIVDWVINSNKEEYYLNRAILLGNMYQSSTQFPHQIPNRLSYEIISNRLYQFYDKIHPVLDKLIDIEKDNWDAKLSSKPFTILESIIMNEKIDIAIIIALVEEFQKLKELIGNTINIEIDQKTGLYFYKFSIPSQTPDPYLCVAICVGDMGATKTALFTQKCQTRWNARYVVNLGISASLSDDLKVGDVLIANVVENYLEKSKIIDSDNNMFEFIPAGEPYRCSEDLIYRCTQFQIAYDKVLLEWGSKCKLKMLNLVPQNELTALTNQNKISTTPNFLIGHLASGPSVGSSSNFIKWLKSIDRKYLALDMESGGVLIALSMPDSTAKSMVIRGISDYGDKFKNDFDNIKDGVFRTIAIQNAFSLLLSLSRTGIFS